MSKTEVTELGLSVDVLPDAVAVLDEKMRGQYDVSRLERDHPRLVGMVTWMLTFPHLKWDDIAQHSGLAWESVAAIAQAKRPAIREFKGRLAGQLALVLEASGPGLMERARKGDVSPLDFKLLAEAWALLSGEATQRVEMVESAEMADFRKLFMASKMGLGPENLAQGAVGPMRPAEGRVVEVETVPRDIQSPD